MIKLIPILLFCFLMIFSASSLEIILKHFRDLYPDNSIEMPNKMSTIYNITLAKVNDTFFKVNAELELLEDFDDKIYVFFGVRYPLEARKYKHYYNETMEPFCKMIGLDSAKDFYNGLVPSSNLPQNLACPLLKGNYSIVDYVFEPKLGKMPNPELYIIEIEYYRGEDMLGGHGFYCKIITDEEK